MDDFLKIVQALEDSNISMKEITKTKEQKGGFLGILLGTLWASLLKPMLTVKGMLKAGYGNKKGKRVLRAGYWNKMDL